MNHAPRISTIAAAAACAIAMSPALAAEPDWATVSGQQVLLFQPGQSSWEWLVVPARHDGARRMREGRNCLYCHEGEERVIGEAIGSGQRLEPTPMAGMPHVVEMDLKAARHGEHIYIRLSWPAMRADRRAGTADASTRATVMLGSDALAPTAIAGCWISCHSDLRGMPEAGGSEREKYLPNSRARMTATGGGDAVRSTDELAAERTAGRILEYTQVSIGADGTAAIGEGYLLDARHEYDDSTATATATLDGGRWTVVIRRPLAPAGRLALQPGKRYSLNVALHENHADGRHHYVAFPLLLGLDRAHPGVVVQAQ